MKTFVHPKYPKIQQLFPNDRNIDIDEAIKQMRNTKLQIYFNLLSENDFIAFDQFLSKVCKSENAKYHLNKRRHKYFIYDLNRDSFYGSNKPLRDRNSFYTINFLSIIN